MRIYVSLLVMIAFLIDALLSASLNTQELSNSIMVPGQQHTGQIMKRSDGDILGLGGVLDTIEGLLSSVFGAVGA